MSPSVTARHASQTLGRCPPSRRRRGAGAARPSAAGRTSRRGWRTGLDPENQNLPAYVALPDPRCADRRSRNLVERLAAADLSRNGRSLRRAAGVVFESQKRLARRRSNKAGCICSANQRPPQTRPGELDLDARIASFELVSGRQPLPRPDAARSQPGNRRDAGPVRPRQRRHQVIRQTVPDGPPARRTGRAVRADFHVRPAVG